MVCATNWQEIEGIAIRPTDRAQERVTAPRVAALGVFALGARKQRREAKLSVKTSSGQGIFLVRGATPSELQARLGPLIACVGQKTSEAYWAEMRVIGAYQKPLG